MYEVTCGGGKISYTAGTNPVAGEGILCGIISIVATSSSSTTQSSSSVGIVYGSPVIYEGETYETVIIGTQTWFKRNLNYAAEGSKCYAEGVSGVSTDSIARNCTTYGRLYNWATAKVSCPSGWHLPTQDQWDILSVAVGGKLIGGKKLKATIGWNDYQGKSGNGEDTYGFSALPGGRNIDGSFNSAGSNGYWWTARESESNDGDAYYWHISYYSDVSTGGGVVLPVTKTIGHSVRCLKDN